MEISTFQCPKCRTILQIAGPLKPGRIIHCTQCEFIFAAPGSFFASALAGEEDGTGAPELGGSYLEPATWVEWSSSANVESSLPPPPSWRLRRRFRTRRPTFSWVFLIVGLLCGLAAVGVLIVLIVALFSYASRKSL